MKAALPFVERLATPARRISDVTTYIEPSVLEPSDEDEDGDPDDDEGDVQPAQDISPSRVYVVTVKQCRGLTFDCPEYDDKL